MGFCPGRANDSGSIAKGSHGPSTCSKTRCHSSSDSERAIKMWYGSRGGQGVSLSKKRSMTSGGVEAVGRPLSSFPSLSSTNQHGRIHSNCVKVSAKQPLTGNRVRPGRIRGVHNPLVAQPLLRIRGALARDALSILAALGCLP
jgi:hypothetical protein